MNAVPIRSVQDIIRTCCLTVRSFQTSNGATGVWILDVGPRPLTLQLELPLHIPTIALSIDNNLILIQLLIPILVDYHIPFKTIKIKPSVGIGQGRVR